MSQYQYDVEQAALSDVGFDPVNARDIADLHGEDPGRVLQDIRDLRAALTLNLGV